MALNNPIYFSDFLAYDYTDAFANKVTFTLTAPAVPEPASWALMLAGFGVVGGVLRGKRKAKGALA